MVCADMALMMDKLIGIVGIVGSATLIGYSLTQFGYEWGKRDAIANYQCPPDTAYSVHYPDGRLKCITPAIRKETNRKELAWMSATRDRMGRVKE